MFYKSRQLIQYLAKHPLYQVYRLLIVFWTYKISINQQIKAGEKGADWDGVRNYQAANNLKKMEKGDLCFFYHSNIGKEIVGIVEVIKTAFIDPTDKEKRFVAVKVRFKSKLQNPVTLENIKKTKALENLSLIRQSRLSVMPIDTKSWKIILKMGRIN